MNDSSLELISLFSIFAGLALCFFLVFDYTPADAFFLEENDDNSFLEGVIIDKRQSGESGNSTIISIYSCRNFPAYFKGEVSSEVNESIHVKGSFDEGFFIIEEYY